MNRDILAIARKCVTKAENERPHGIEAAYFAEEELGRLPIISNEDVMKFLSRCAVQPGIVKGLANPRFGQPSIIVDESESWVFELICWRTMVTAIHEHSYYGAFKTLEGDRLHFEFDFQENFQFPNDKSTKLGILSCTKLDLIKPGKVSKILKEREFIHSVWPVSNTACTFVLRQKGVSNSWSYLPNQITYDEILAERYLKNRLPYLVNLRLYSKEKFNSCLLLLFERSPFSVCIYLVLALGLSTEQRIFKMLIECLNARNKHFAEALIEITTIDEVFREAYNLKINASTREQQMNLGFLFYSKVLDSKSTIKLASLCELIDY